MKRSKIYFINIFFLGIIGGKFFNEVGGGVDIFCLFYDLDDVFCDFFISIIDLVVYMYGSEY